jgi:hypothetical protein
MRAEDEMQAPGGLDLRIRLFGWENYRRIGVFLLNLIVRCIFSAYLGLVVS